MSTPRPVSRRAFLSQSAAAGAALTAATGLKPSWALAANDRLRFACIGVGGKGSSDTDHVAALGEIVALCDIDSERLGAKASKFPQAQTFADFRVLFEELSESIDAVVVSCPDHTHAPAALMAMRLNKPVYCQKPLTHSPYEARLMRETAARRKLVTQMGNQGTSHPGFRRNVEALRAGLIGPIQEVHVWTNRPFKYWKQAPDLVARPEPMPVPPNVAWDLFLGPAPERPYAKVYHPHDWRGWWAFGTGALGDMGCHTANLPFQALRLGLPTRVSAQSSAVNDETCPAWATITYEFPARGDLPPVKLTWYEGARDGQRNLPDPALFSGQTPTDSGSLLVGTKGKLYSPSDYGSDRVLIGLEAPDEPKPTGDQPKINADTLHKAEWVRGILEQNPTLPWSNFGYAGTLTEAMLLGNVAVRTGQPIDYDAATGQVTNVPDANRLVRPLFRQGWGL